MDLAEAESDFQAGCLLGCVQRVEYQGGIWLVSPLYPD